MTINIPEISSEKWIEVSNYAYANSIKLIEDAKILIKNNSYGHAYSLASLAIEEFSKYQLCLSLSIDFVPEQIKQEIWEKIRNHIFKIEMFKGRLFLQYTFGEIYFRPLEIEEQINNLDLNHDEKVKIIVQHKKDILERIKNLAFNKGEEANKFDKWMKILEKLNLEKQKGFYVDIENTKITSPLDIKKEKVDELITFFENELLIISKYAELNNNLSEDKKNELYELAKESYIEISKAIEKINK